VLRFARVLGLLALAVAVLLAPARTPRAHADGDVLHEFVPDVDPDEPLRALERGGQAPEAIEYQGEVLPAPEPQEGGETPAMIAAPGDGAGPELPGQRSPSFAPDRQTELEGTLQYHASFNPEVAPFKRVTALDAIVLGPDGKTPVLAVADPRRRTVPVEGADSAPPDARPRDRFWGEATLDFSSGAAVPLPSVSPESRILSVRSEPSSELVIQRDGADNFFAVPKGKRPASPVFLAFLTDAPRSYFASVPPHGPVSALAEHVPPFDAGVRKRALGFAKELGLGPRSDLAAALNRLVAHFRAFEESAEPPPDTGDVYLDLARAKKGVCRHRAYAFVITAQALGIPSRFVQNEAHSWVEVELPKIGWLRIDLGGAAHGLTAHGAEDRPLYRPVEPDPLPRPAAYEESYSQLGRGTRGMRKPGDEQLQGRWVAPNEEGAASGEAAQASGQATFMSLDSAPALRGGGLDGPRTPDTSGRATLEVTLEARSFEALRGNALALAGNVHDAAGSGVEGLRVEVSLAADGRRERMLLGVAVTGQGGVFSGSFSVPPDLAPGDYRLVVVTPGNAKYQPAIAE
jgi:hypothetical protein